jgi:hypothetical protein
MRIQVVGGAGQGLYGIVNTYNAGSKIATVIRESDGAAGWDHLVPGTPFVSPNSSSTYQIEPYVSFTAPTKSSAAITLPTSTTWNAVKYVETSDQYTNVTTTTDSDGTGVSFDVTRNGERYYLELNAGGSSYTRLDTVTILGTDVGGASPLNDITVTLTTVDSDGVVVDFDFEGVGQKGKFVATGGTTNGAVSIDGETWTAETLPAPSSGNWTSIASGLQDDGSSTYKASAVVLVGDGANNAAYSVDADTWATSTLPAGLDTSGTNTIAYATLPGTATNRFLVVASADQDIAYSDNGGAVWTIVSTALPGTGYSRVTYGAGKFVAIDPGSSNAAYSEDGITWTGVTAPGLFATPTDIVYGNGRFVAIGGANDIMYSLDGITWYENTLTMPILAGERKIAYGQGMFVISGSDTDEVQYSQDGLYWQSYTLATTITGGYNAIAFGNPNREGKFVILQNNAGTGGAYAKIGATARGRAGVANEQVFEIRMTEPGSGYTSAPTATVTDPNNINDVLLVERIGKGAIAQPTFISRGSGFTSAAAEILDAESNGNADFFQNGNFVAIRRVTTRPVAGSNVVFDSIPDTTYKLVSVVSFVGDNDGSYTCFLQISPDMSIELAPPDGDPVTMRIRYSQVRLTGHDFLDIGTGNFDDTNYPEAVYGPPVNTPDQTKETTDAAGGRVFFTATDQDGNFRVGDLFSIEQATGVATLNAEAFNIAGLQELTLGEVTLGGNSAAISEFSTDPFFTANSDTIVPTQRAIKAYIEAQIGGGGASLIVNSVTAGDIFIGTNQITTVSGSPINIKANVVFEGTVLGLPLAYNYYLRT